jgi:hypothetical protein
MSRGPDPAAAGDARHHRLMAVFIVGFLAFLALMAWAERAGLSRDWIGPIFLFLSVMAYAGIGTRAPPTRRSSTSPAGAFRRCTTAWRRRPTG